MTSLPQVIMAEEQEVNQRSIISQPASGGKGPSHVGTHANLGTRHTAGPASLWSTTSVLCLCARSNLLS